MSNRIIHIHDDTEKSVSSKAQQKFNALRKKIEAQKTVLQEWHDAIPKYQHRVHDEYQPLWDSYNAHRIKLVHLLDEAYGDKSFKKTDKAKIKDILTTVTMELISQHGKDELKELYNRYSDTDFDAEYPEQDDFIAEIFYDDAPEERRNHRKKSAKQLEIVAQEKEDAQNMSKSIQAVFRQLVAVLHPDREPDEEERNRKTKLMQRANTAYAKKDLLQLLALQLEIEQINQTQLNTIAENRLRHFNKILQTQLDELNQEIVLVESPFREHLNIPSHLPLSMKQVLKALQDDMNAMKFSITKLKRDIKDLQKPANLKMMLKAYRL